MDKFQKTTSFPGPGRSLDRPASAEYLTDAMTIVRAKGTRMFFRVDAYPGIVFELAPEEKPTRHKIGLPEQVGLF
jgi:hypothetical protein